METLRTAAANADSPAVVFLAGGGAIGRDYWNVHRKAAELTTSVIYDRAGTGDGTPALLPRTSMQVTDELRALLRDSGIDGPYLLAGHSLGGLYARHYAARFPSEVAALLLLDPAHEDYNAYMPAPLREIYESFNASEAIPDFDALPEALVQHYRGLFAQEMASSGRPRSASHSLITTSAHTASKPASRKRATSSSSIPRSVLLEHCPASRCSFFPPPRSTRSKLLFPKAFRTSCCKRRSPPSSGSTPTLPNQCPAGRSGQSMPGTSRSTCAANRPSWTHCKNFSPPSPPVRKAA